MLGLGRVGAMLALMALAMLATFTACGSVGVGIGGGSGGAGGGIWVQGSPGSPGSSGSRDRESHSDQANATSNALAVPSSARISGNMQDWLQSEAEVTDLKAVNHGLEHNKAGEDMRWRNFDTNLDYMLTPGELAGEDGRRCRDFMLRVDGNNGERRELKGAACRADSGQWSLVRGE